jgi:OFA family oxalate/formate antiporter-like MFS transporter
MKPAGKKPYYGWYITAVSFWGYFLSTGTGFYAFNAFLEPLCTARDWTRTDLNLALVIGTVFGFLSQYIYGTIVMQTGIRRLMLLGSSVAGGAFILFARVDSLWQFYLCYIFLFIGNGAYGGIVAGTAVNNWFVKKRGTAMGLATAGMSVSGAVLPMAALMLIRYSGIENAAFCIGLLIIGFGPLAWFLVRDWPEELGLTPEGLLPENSEHPLPVVPTPLQIHLAPGRPRGTQWPLSRLAASPVFWKIGFSFGLMMIGTVGVMSQLKPRFSDIGFSSVTAMLMMAATALAGAMGKYSWGFLCDRLAPRWVVAAMALFNCIGLGLGLINHSSAALMIFIPVFGFAMGGIMSTLPVMVATFFGRKNFSSVLRYISIFLVLQMFGYLIAGQSYDITGSYDAAYMVFIGLDLISVLLLLSLKQAPP